MAGQNKVTVVIPTFGRARFLGEALGSLANQTRRPDQVIVVDDGSSPPAVLPPGHGLEVTIVRHARNMGPGAARNTGLAHATGEFVIFLDDDDLLMPTRIATGLSEIGDSRAHACAVVEILADGKTRRLTDRFTGDMRSTFTRVAHPSMGQLLHRRTDIVQFDPTLRVAEDKDWWVRMAHAADFAESSDVGLQLRRHQTHRAGVDPVVRYEARRLVHQRHQSSTDRQTRARLRNDVAAAALLAGRRSSAAFWAIRSLASALSLLGFKLLIRSATPARP